VRDHGVLEEELGRDIVLAFLENGKGYDARFAPRIR